jgi:hypothetical protein
VAECSEQAFTLENCRSQEHSRSVLNTSDEDGGEHSPKRTFVARLKKSDADGQVVHEGAPEPSGQTAVSLCPFARSQEQASALDGARGNDYNICE